ncbi:biopolymer transport protein ExbD/TolR family protein [Asticcacaulis biprosthecium C19]|uniref:Biopolymer transport protein ExbD/TolR family protein n=1 Tax=Asticcacaulis biprosthecium C19 TaxID=715226 RepID=F4QKQ8_9CAUL|nr:biopolymer transporter ExbD [Asticcacaulis biprosthecium]EGF93360.1 biopolymer transport protein ExbD/TolR family protein [Asticcacaulis biprosthecium C19]
MAMGSAGSGGSRRGNRRVRRRSALSEINVTPMVDVMLVLLIIFMISAPLLNSGIDINLPKTEAAALKEESDPITVSVDRAGRLYVNDNPVSYDTLAPRLVAMTQGETDRPIYVRGDGDSSWKMVAQVMGKLSSSGFTKISIVTDPMGKTSGGAASSAAAGTGASS